jgi:hypothetical protein
MSSRGLTIATGAVLSYPLAIRIEGTMKTVTLSDAEERVLVGALQNAIPTQVWVQNVQLKAWHKRAAKTGKKEITAEDARYMRESRATMLRAMRLLKKLGAPTLAHPERMNLDLPLPKVRAL